MKTKIVAELSYNHFGNLDLLIELIVSAKKSGATHIKFEKRSQDSYRNFMSIKKNYELTDFQIKELITVCKKNNLEWFCSLRDLKSAQEIQIHNPRIIKIASREARDYGYIEKIINIYEDRVDYIVSTGGLDIKQIENVFNTFRQLNLEKKLTISHCVSKYPYSIEESNINRIKTLKEKFNCSIGYSGHEYGIIPSVYASIIGANYIERHFAINRNLVVKSNPNYKDEKCTLIPSEFKEMVDLIISFKRLMDLPIREKPLEDELKRLLK